MSSKYKLNSSNITKSNKKLKKKDFNDDLTQEFISQSMMIMSSTSHSEENSPVQAHKYEFNHLRYNLSMLK